MDEVFKALADPSRRALLDSLNAHNGQTLAELCSGLEMARQSVSKHLAVLESANIVTTMWRGREKLHYLNAEPINAIAERWIKQYDRKRVRALATLKRALETTDMSEFVYTSYIKTTPEKLWAGLTDPAFTRDYWDLAFETDWKKGSEMTWDHGTVVLSGPEQVVLESDPFRRLSYTWHNYTREWAALHSFPEDVVAALLTESRSKVTYEIEPHGDMVKLTVLHDDLGPMSASMVSQGWPSVISSLKSLLETGASLPRG